MASYNNILKNHPISKKNRDRIITIIIFLVPTLFLLAVFIIYPIFASAQLSFFKWDSISPVKQFVGLKNWITLFGDRVFIKSVTIYNKVL